MKTVQLLVQYGAHSPGEFANFSDNEVEHILGRNPKRQVIGHPAKNVRMLQGVTRAEAPAKLGYGIHPNGAKKGQHICLAADDADRLIKSGAAVETVQAQALDTFTHPELGEIQGGRTFACTRPELEKLDAASQAQEYLDPEVRDAIDAGLAANRQHIVDTGKPPAVRR